MSSSADIYMNGNGNGNANDDHILRPRAVKPGNPAVLRTLSEEGLLSNGNSIDGSINGATSGQTRYACRMSLWS